MDLYLIKTLTGLKPADQISEDKYKKIALNETRKYKVTKPRNLGFHKKYFVLLNLVFENQDEYKTQEELLDNIKIKLRMYDIKKSFDGKPYPKLHSISFANMDQYKFEKFYKKTLTVLSDFIKVDSYELEQEVINLM